MKSILRQMDASVKAHRGIDSSNDMDFFCTLWTLVDDGDFSWICLIFLSASYIVMLLFVNLQEKS